MFDDSMKGGEKMSQSTINAWIRVLKVCGGRAFTELYEYHLAWDANGACLMRRLRMQDGLWEFVGYGE